MLVRSSSSGSIGAMDKRSGDEHNVIASFSTDPEEDETIMNEENFRPEYSQTEDTATYDDFRLQGIMRNVKKEENDCYISSTPWRFQLSLHECSDNCRCTECLTCERNK